MEEIKVNDYIRIKSGYIAKVLKIRKEYSFTTTTGHKANYQERYFIDNGKCSISKPYIKKHSPNIIDLIEEGDYVNGKEVIDIEKFEDGTIYIKFSEHDYISGICVEKIKTIATKEQFAKIIYEV